ncbi:hypothetical protein F5148DRAFT_1153534 [Russula earlei]|uniref:Uncharacterized protein n=1 Tax=Russula earlei TaxID=71964 RepID=A0ACC0TTI7_9AGAM|nr:hypothetical protein F5148DRAFT_1153534 [Russula earlei]
MSFYSLTSLSYSTEAHSASAVKTRPPSSPGPPFVRGKSGHGEFVGLDPRAGTDREELRASRDRAWNATRKRERECVCVFLKEKWEILRELRCSLAHERVNADAEALDLIP